MSIASIFKKVFRNLQTKQHLPRTETGPVLYPAANVLPMCLPDNADNSDNSSDIVDGMSIPCLDWLQVVASGLNGRNHSSNLKRLSEELIGLAVTPVGKNHDSVFVHDYMGVMLFWEQTGLRVVFPGRFWTLQPDDWTGVQRVRTIVDAINERFGILCHVTRADAKRDFRNVPTMDMFEMPTETVYWNFVPNDFNPINQRGGIYVAGPNRQWEIKVYDKKKNVLEAEKVPHVIEAHTARWESFGVDLDKDSITRLEVRLGSKESCKRLTKLMYEGTLEGAHVFHAWCKRRAIYQCPPDKNSNVSEKSKKNRWPLSAKWRERMLVPPQSRKGTGAAPKLNLRDTPVSLKNRIGKVCDAAVQRWISWPELRDLVFQDYFERAISRRADKVADRIASTSYLRPLSVEALEKIDPSHPSVKNIIWILSEAGIEKKDQVTIFNLFIGILGDPTNCDSRQEFATEFVKAIQLNLAAEGDAYEEKIAEIFDPQSNLGKNEGSYSSPQAAFAGSSRRWRSCHQFAEPEDDGEI